VLSTRRKKGQIRKGIIVRINPDDGRAFVRWKDKMGWMDPKYLKLETQ
jgi:hypothetical protein